MAPPITPYIIRVKGLRKNVCTELSLRKAVTRKPLELWRRTLGIGNHSPGF